MRAGTTPVGDLPVWHNVDDRVIYLWQFDPLEVAVRLWQKT